MSEVRKTKIANLTLGQFLVFVLVGVVTAVLLPSSWWAACMAGLFAATPMMAVAGRRLCQNRLPPRPKEPVARVPHMRFRLPEPASIVLQPSDRCEICNRVLTNPESRLKRVGMECVKTYGPRYRYGPNPAHAYWRAEMARAEAALAVERAQARVEHQEAVASYRRQVNEWTQLLQAPENVERAARRGAAFVLLAQAMLGGTI